MKNWLGKNLIKIYAFLAFTYLFIPVIYTFIFSFNNSSKSNLVWRGFTLNNWKNPCGAPDVCNALGNSLKIGLISTALMFSAPILYPINALPEVVRPWLYLNPLTFLVEQLRNVLLFGGVIDWLGLFIYAVAAVFVVIFGWWVFDRTKKGFADVL